MADQNDQNNNLQQVSGQGSGEAGEQRGGNGSPGPVPYERFRQVNDELKTVKEQLTQLQQAQRTAADQKLADEKKWEELARQREAELKAEKQARLRLEVASKKGLPVDLAGRLQGETAEDMEKDAEAILQFLKPASGPGVPPAGKGSSPAPLDFSKMSAAEIREKAKGKAVGELVK